MLTKSSLRLRVFLVIAIIILLNIVMSRFFVRLDFTGDKIYTLSDATENVLKDLDKTATVTAYFSEELPVPFQKVKRDFRDMLVEYANLSGGNVVYEFVNPNENDEMEQQARADGIVYRDVQVNKRDQATLQRVYMGAKIQYDDKSEAIPIIMPNKSAEYDLTSKISKMAVANKPKVGFVTGHSEATPATMIQVREELNVTFDVETTSLLDSSVVNNYQALVVVAPVDSFSQEEITRLDDFLGMGKGVLLALNRVDIDMQNNLAAKGVTTGLETWLGSKGINVKENFVKDKECSQISVPVQQEIIPGFPMMTYQQIQFPYIPIVKKFDQEHEISKGLEQMVLPFTSSLEYVGDSKVNFHPIVFSSDQSGAVDLPYSFIGDVQKKLNEYSFSDANLVIGATVEGKLAGDTDARMVVFGDGDFGVNGQGQQMQQLPPDNVSLFVNSVNWLVNNVGLNSLRTKEIQSRPIKKLSDGERQFIKWGNFLLPIVLIVIYGVIRTIFRNRKRSQWAKERYA